MSEEKSVLDELKEKFKDTILETHDFAGDFTVSVKAENWVGINKYLKEESHDRYDYMSDLCGVDFLD